MSEDLSPELRLRASPRPRCAHSARPVPSAQGKGRDGVQLLKPETVRKFTRAYRVGMYDEVQGVYCDWSLGFFVGAPMCVPGPLGAAVPRALRWRRP